MAEWNEKEFENEEKGTIIEETIAEQPHGRPGEDAAGGGDHADRPKKRTAASIKETKKAAKRKERARKKKEPGGGAAKAKALWNRLSGKFGAGDGADGEGGKGKKRMKSFLIPLLIVTVVVIVVIAVNVYQRHKEEQAKLDKEELFKEQASNQLSDQTDTFHFRITAHAEYPNGSKKPGNLFIENPVDSPYRMRVTLKEAETDTVLYRTKVIEPGENESGFALNEKLSKGEHAVTAVIEAFELDGKAESAVSTSTADLTIDVKK